MSRFPVCTRIDLVIWPVNNLRLARQCCLILPTSLLLVVTATAEITMLSNVSIAIKSIKCSETPFFSFSFFTRQVLESVMAPSINRYSTIINLLQLYDGTVTIVTVPLYDGAVTIDGGSHDTFEHLTGKKGKAKKGGLRTFI